MSTKKPDLFVGRASHCPSSPHKPSCSAGKAFLCPASLGPLPLGEMITEIARWGIPQDEIEQSARHLNNLFDSFRKRFRTIEPRNLVPLTKRAQSVPTE
jgi:hypothetical protein